jgi:hypothetical protein
MRSAMRIAVVFGLLAGGARVAAAQCWTCDTTQPAACQYRAMSGMWISCESPAPGQCIVGSPCIVTRANGDAALAPDGTIHVSVAKRELNRMLAASPSSTGATACRDVLIAAIARERRSLVELPRSTYGPLTEF